MGCDSKLGCTAVLLAMAFGLAGCPSASPPSCELNCPVGYVCAEPSRCFTTDCGECRKACDPATPETNTCQSGQECVPNTDDPVASAGFCDSCLDWHCPPGSQCMGDVCRPVECGVNVACARATDFCDLWVNACYPSNGACTSVSDCPHFDGSILRVGELTCHEGFCRLGALPPLQVPGLEGSEPVEVLAPKHGSRYASVDALQLDWSGPRAAAIVLILEGVPEKPGEVLNLAVWGASVPGDQPASLHVEDGVEIIDGAWTPTHATGLPENTPLYVLVQLVEGDRLLAISPLVPFIVGRSWKEPGEACTGSSECENPRYVQACVEGRCRVRCASNRDCLPWSQTCAWPEEGLRTCR